MARRTTFGKIERDREKKAKAQAKRERREGRATADPSDDPETSAEPTGGRMSQDEVLAQLSELHEQFDRGDIEFDDFEERKAALLANLAVE
jgi:hypothetical protein